MKRIVLLLTALASLTIAIPSVKATDERLDNPPYLPTEKEFGGWHQAQKGDPKIDPDNYGVLIYRVAFLRNPDKTSFVWVRLEIKNPSDKLCYFRAEFQDIKTVSKTGDSEKYINVGEPKIYDDQPIGPGVKTILGRGMLDNNILVFVREVEPIK